jgi:hypothetical protein
MTGFGKAAGPDKQTKSQLAGLSFRLQRLKKLFLFALIFEE